MYTCAFCSDTCVLEELREDCLQVVNGRIVRDPDLGHDPNCQPMTRVQAAMLNLKRRTAIQVRQNSAQSNSQVFQAMRDDVVATAIHENVPYEDLRNATPAEFRVSCLTYLLYLLLLASCICAGMILAATAFESEPPRCASYCRIRSANSSSLSGVNKGLVCQWIGVWYTLVLTYVCPFQTV